MKGVTDGLKEIKSIPAKQTGTLVRFIQTLRYLQL